MAGAASLRSQVEKMVCRAGSHEKAGSYKFSSIDGSKAIGPFVHKNLINFDPTSSNYQYGLFSSRIQ
jgi:hypothetical protein